MSNFGVEPICEAIEFPVPTYYAVKKREGNPSLRAMRDEELPPLIRAAREEVIGRTTRFDSPVLTAAAGRSR